MQILSEKQRQSMIYSNLDSFYTINDGGYFKYKTCGIKYCQQAYFITHLTSHTQFGNVLTQWKNKNINYVLNGIVGNKTITEKSINANL